LLAVALVLVLLLLMFGGPIERMFHRQMGHDDSTIPDN
jgi:hypothetical protein